jgi:SAM-dependent methyltransferase
MTEKNRLAKIDSWVNEILVDPLSKNPLSVSGDGLSLVSTYGRKYPVVGGVYDLRLLNNQTTSDQKIWSQGQLHYEEWDDSYTVTDSPNYNDELNGVRDVYEAIPIEGRCLDVGGHQGRLRAFLCPGQEYISCDPFLNVFQWISKSPNLIRTYPFLVEPVNFVSCQAEFLPFASCSFQTVHMRSVIDHFLNPELALNEAYRVLKEVGNLIVGLYVHGGKNGKVPLRDHLKEAVRLILPIFGIHKYADHHVWHPTYEELKSLISTCGFKIAKVHWQECHNGTVCYIKATKEPGLTRHAH